MGKTHRSHRNAKGPTPQLRSRNTRSSKGRLLTETSSSTTQLTTQLSLLGLYAAATIGDGNCLFRALSDQLYGSPSKHQDLRQQICDHIAKHKSRYEPFVEDERGLEAHLRAMRENATYGGHMELSAFAHMTERNVKVIQPGLVYVIEWNAAGWEDGAGSTSVIAAGSSSSSSGQTESSRRTSRRSTKSVSLSKAQEETRIKLGKGYYVYEEVGSEEEEDFEIKLEELEDSSESRGPTVYVAYHDWEHFSSIRNLRGPHTGLPSIVETPPPSMEDPEQSAKEREKERDRERKRERERKEKEKERERKGKERKENENGAEAGTSSSTLPKVKLKLSPSVSDANASPPVSVNVGTGPSSSSSLTPVASSRSVSQSLQDPSSIPLPISRSASPFVGPPSSLVPSSATSPLPSSSLSNEVYPEDVSPNAHISTLEGERLGHGHRHPHAHVLQTPRSQYRSPKRTFDESSASGAEEDPENSKRSRRRRVGSGGWSGTGADGVSSVVVGDNDDEMEGVNIVMQADVDCKADEADTPCLSAPGSTSSSPLSSVASSVSGASSEVDVDDDVELESQADDPGIENLDILPLSPALPTTPDDLDKEVDQEYLHAHPHRGAGDRPLTRRQRKALGLPKPRKGVTSNIHGSNGSLASLSAGKIVIPGGKWRGKGDNFEQTVAGFADSQGDEQWRKNGSGRLDVRGFRELRI